LAEGDTILRAARRIEAAIAGQELAVGAPSPRGRAAGVGRLDGLRLHGVRTHGKNLLFDFGELCLHSHLGMNGAWHVYGRGERWAKASAAAWAVLRGERSEAVQFGGPTLRVLSPGQARLDPRLARLGPDILAPGFDTAATASAIRAAGGERPLGDVLLDQRLVAGIGNVFKSEGCFAAALDPWRKVSEMAPDELERALDATRGLMSSAVESGRAPRAVYRRAGEPCPRCGARVRAGGQGDANRTTYWCPRCQA
jgi:endonuclease-8